MRYASTALSFLAVSVLTLVPSLVACMGNSPTKDFGAEAASVISKRIMVQPTGANVETATMAAGCFWGLELAFQRVPGVVKTEVGYTQGTKANPTYEEVCSGITGHAEALQIKYDPKVVSYEELLTVYWDRLDPTTRNRQGNDVGTQYRFTDNYEWKNCGLNFMSTHHIVIYCAVSPQIWVVLPH